MPEVTIRVFLCPHDSQLAGGPQTGWPRPAGLRLQLVNGGGKTYDLTTDATGTAKVSSVAVGTYKVNLVDEFTDFATQLYRSGAAADTVSVAPGTGVLECDLALAPPIGAMLVPLRLVYRDPAGKEIGLAGVGVTVAARPGQPGNDFVSRADGTVYAYNALGSVQVRPQPEVTADLPSLQGRKELAGRAAVPEAPQVAVVLSHDKPRTMLQLVYQPATDEASIVVNPYGEGGDLTMEVAEEGAAPRTVTVPAGGGSFSVQPGLVKIKARRAGAVAVGETHVHLVAGDELDISGLLGFGQAPLEGVVMSGEHGIRGRVRDGLGHPRRYVKVTARQVAAPDKPYRGRTDGDGRYEIAVPKPGAYYVEVPDEDVETIQVTVQSWAEAEDVVLAAESLTDLAAYPVLTEEVSTRGTGPVGAERTGTGEYGQQVSQVIRDVLGWRPTTNSGGFQAALAGAFQLRQVEGHTEWTWQQRGYAVQADLGALTGAQASIYARAKNARDQIVPLLDGLTPLRPDADLEDTEAIRNVVRAELNELVAELGIEGGPRIQRVDELFDLLVGGQRRQVSLDPDTVGGQLATLRERFGLTIDRVNTLEEERQVTNLRVVVEQLLFLDVGWQNDRALFTGDSPRTSFGTALIQLSRQLEVVAESVDELTFALDSVFVDAAQRGVTRLRFRDDTLTLPALPLGTGNTTVALVDEPSILLSDLLDWVTRASTDEGRQLIQDAGKDGVVAFEPVLDKLRQLVHATAKAAFEGHGVPAGMRTPRVKLALTELADQLDGAADLAFKVRRERRPDPFVALAATNLGGVTVEVQGRFLDNVTTASLDISDRSAALETDDVTAAFNTAVANFPGLTGLPGAGTVWFITLVTDDGTESEPIEVVTRPGLQPKGQVAGTRRRTR
jgi:hypothetical protein